MSDSYLNSLNKNKEHFENYYLKSFQKTEQQKFLETLLSKEKFNLNLEIADIACGAGSLSYHLNSYLENSTFCLVDYNTEAIELAKQNLPLPNFSFYKDSVYELDTLKEKQFDIVFCWQTLSWLEEPEKALNKLLSITKPGGKIYLSSLFNINHDVDVYSKIKDYSSISYGKTIEASYNTYSKYSIEKWIQGKSTNFEIIPFETPVDFEFSGKGIGTYTINSERGKLQFSAGMMLNWGVLIIEK